MTRIFAACPVTVAALIAAPQAAADPEDRLPYQSRVRPIDLIRRTWVTVTLHGANPCG